jgi:hypothetical protein
MGAFHVFGKPLLILILRGKEIKIRIRKNPDGKKLEKTR